MASQAFDVWMGAANTVYKGVPFGVVTDWAQQGRVGADDKVRPAGSSEPWVRAADHPTIADYLFVKVRGAKSAVPGKLNEALEPVEMDVGWRRKAFDEDDDPDMIPLIDISLVLLVFFMMTAVVSALSPVDVPGTKHAAELHGDPNALTVHIDKRPTGEVFYAVRVGDRNPDPADASFETLDEVIRRVEQKASELKAGGKEPPSVRFACHKDLPSERTHELTKELQKLQDKSVIGYYGAEVNEKK